MNVGSSEQRELERVLVEEGSVLMDERPSRRKRGKGDLCDGCGHISCICPITRLHVPECRFRRAAVCPVGIACDPHGRDVCPICDPCDCPNSEAREQERSIQNRFEKRSP